MARWEPNGRGRLRDAAMELYLERGFDQTTVADIAERAGLTERTFFRHFADKREVLFGGQDLLHELTAKAIAEAPDSAAPIDVMESALIAVCEMIGQDRDFSRQRQSVIDANAALRERELIKLAALAETSAEALRARGVPEPAASLAAEVGIAAFKIGFTRWVSADRGGTLVESARAAMAEVKTVTAG
ncbi:AcrR family transcriptional regulator [Nocardia sp. GAS34]|uniref:TetR family transcriptional regulator n=1 Tax=unclassified Nocardia TaxID=2637762 RepID=UPI003D1B3A85